MALFKTTAELVNFIKIDVNLKFSKIQSSIELAEADFIKPLLGKEFYEELLAAYQAAPGDALSAELAAVLPYVQKALAYYAGFLSVEELGVVVGDAGIQQTSTVNSQPAPAWKVKDLKIKYITAADKSADLLLEFLELAAIIPDGGTENDRLYKKWYDDTEANTAISGCIVYKTSIANKYIDILDSRRLFLRLKKRIREIEAGYVKSLVCGPQYQEILDMLRGTLAMSEEVEALLPLLQSVISKKALYATLPMLPVIISADGLFLQSSNDSVIQKLQAGQAEKSALMLQLKEGEYTGYESDERKIQKFLDENIDDYPLIKNSACWSGTTTVTDDKYSIDNDPCNKHFST